MKKIWIFIFWFLIILFLEFTFRLSLYGNLFNSNILYLIVFSVLNSFGIYVITTSFGKKFNKVISFIILGIVVLLFLIQLVYYKIFTAFFTLDAVTMAKGILPFVKTIFEVLWSNILYVIALLSPIVVFIIINKHLEYKRTKIHFVFINLLILLNIMCISVLSLDLTDNKEDNYSAKKLYFNIYYPAESIKKFGLVTTMSLDLNRILFNSSETAELIVVDNNKEINVEYDYNIMDIDWETLIANEKNETIKNMHSYFSSTAGTQQNKYTGLFEGKNLIFIIAESLYTPFISEELTPNLYNLYNNGIVFDNYYPFKYPKSTTDSEYMLMTSLLPKEGANKGSATASSKNYFPFSIGNVFSNINYTTKAFHNWNNIIYDRVKYVANYGFDYYDAPKLGIPTNLTYQLSSSPRFPTSDLDMVNITHSYYMDSESFATYYITVSGHLNYEYNINKMVRKNWKLVKDLEYSKKVKSYIACNLEFEFAVGRLVELLEEKGILDDTIIVVSTDHYPYGLTVKEMKELNNTDISEPFTINKSKLLIYNSATEGKIINKVASSIDVLPTLLNLFNVEYDSRLLIGNDLFSDSDGLAIFSDRSFITDYGYFNSKKDELVIYEDSTDVDKTYFDNLKSEINNKFQLSRNILDKDYYHKVFKGGD